MPRLRPPAQPSRAAQPPDPQRLPQRWALIVLVAIAAAFAGYLAEGSVAAITLGVVVLLAGDQVLE